MNPLRFVVTVLTAWLVTVLIVVIFWSATASAAEPLPERLCIQCQDSVTIHATVHVTDDYGYCTAVTRPELIEEACGPAPCAEEVGYGLVCHPELVRD